MPLHRALPAALLAPSDTGVPSGLDLGNDGAVAGRTTLSVSVRSPGSTGCSCSPGFPIDTAAVRTFQRLLCKDLPASDHHSTWVDLRVP
jgi:hypothetical protein